MPVPTVPAPVEGGNWSQDVVSGNDGGEDGLLKPTAQPGATVR
jgi:hypothetical protein